MIENQMLRPFQINRVNYDRLESKFSIAKQARRQLDFDIETCTIAKYAFTFRVHDS